MHPFATGLILLQDPFDLHVLSTPPAFILSQDQTLRLIKSQIQNQRGLASYHSLVVKVHSPLSEQTKLPTIGLSAEGKRGSGDSPIV